MARVEMEEIIATVRRMIGDDSSTPQFDDEKIEQAVDGHAFDVYEYELTPVLSRDAEGRRVARELQAGDHPWEAGATLGLSNGEQLDPDDADELRGRWRLAEPVKRAVFATGTHYDINAAAADLLDEWAARVSRQYTFSSSSGQFVRSQQRQGLQAAAAAFRAKAKVTTAELTRSDVIA